ncbi:hypothetical protein [Paracoccus litorisediminis]|uniref:Uncharacterized protein n=1 Tax=Paracoccus litorisediminis TaxID=2006130 RepID=A0A844HMN9_9RHOB|nr:hypothetical protein [Paracoccus litorisediminis]MTH61136.1 hypothetical protein [Paracoccus litorisediminis]
MFFTEIRNTVALLSNRGALQEVKLYAYDGRVHAKIGSSYHALLATDSVRGTNRTLVEVRGDFEIRKGRLYYEFEGEAESRVVQILKAA